VVEGPGITTPGITTRKESVATTLHPAASVLAEIGPASHSNGMEWWVVGLITIAAAAALGVVIALMTFAERKRHPHS
jgi:uncharacterized membrane protein